MTSKDFTVIYDFNLDSTVLNNTEIIKLGINELKLIYTNEKIMLTSKPNSSIKCIPGITYMLVCIFKNNDSNNGNIKLILYVKENLTKVGSININHNINLSNPITKNDVT
jgi:hypothetical protein